MDKAVGASTQPRLCRDHLASYVLCGMGHGHHCAQTAREAVVPENFFRTSFIETSLYAVLPSSLNTRMNHAYKILYKDFAAGFK